MTKEHYIEMCETLGDEVLEEDLPVEMDDFPLFVQNCFLVFYKLTDVWDTMNGNYCGKDYTIVFKLMEVYDLEDDISLALEIIQCMEQTKVLLISEKVKQSKDRNNKKATTK